MDNQQKTLTIEEVSRLEINRKLKIRTIHFSGTGYIVWWFFIGFIGFAVFNSMFEELSSLDSFRSFIPYLIFYVIAMSVGIGVMSSLESKLIKQTKEAYLFEVSKYR